MIAPFYKTMDYVNKLDLDRADELDKTVAWLVNSQQDTDRVRKALDERFNKGAEFVVGLDRGGRLMRIKRRDEGAKRKYLTEGTDGMWYEADEKIWPMAMFELARRKKVK